MRSGARGGSHASSGRSVCYAVLDRAKAKASDAVITSMVPVWHCSPSILFDPGSTNSYVSTYFASDLDNICETIS